MAAFIDKFQRYCGSRTLAWLITGNAAAFLIVWAVIISGNALGIAGNFTMPWLCVSAEPEAAVRHPWTLATYMFTHYDFFHLLFNVLWLYWFGLMLFPRVSGRRLLWLYVGGGLAGALLYVGVTFLAPALSEQGAYLCGASASVLAVMTAAAFIIPDREVNLFLIGSVKLKWVTIACVALTLFGVGGGNMGAQSAHIGGVAFGAIFALAFRRKSSSAHVGNPGSATRPKKIRLNVRRDGNAVAEAAGGRLSDAGRLDQLLDKIRLSGYGSLSTGERNELTQLSKRIGSGRQESSPRDQMSDLN